MSNQPCNQSEQSLSADRAALELFQIAALVLGDESQAVTAVEAGLRESEIDPCDDPEGSRRIVRERVMAEAIRLASAGKEAMFQAPEVSSEVVSCLEEDELSGVGISPSQLNDLVQGAGKERMRHWLEQLPIASRVIFVLRAVSGISGVQTAALLCANAGPSACGWSSESVSAAFRQTLCSLTSLLVQSAQIPETAS